MSKIRVAIVALFALSSLAACGGSASFLTVANQRHGQSIAVVSLAINDYGGSLQGWNSTYVSPLMTSHALEMVHIVEQHLAANYQVVPIEEFIASEHYQGLAQERPHVAMPVIEDWEMPFFGYDRKHMVRAQVAPEMAQALADAAGTDLIAIVYAEWGVRTGRYVPTSKALSKTVMSIHDASGAVIYRGRKDVTGQRTLGAFNRVVVDEGSINEWVDAFARAIDILTSR